jgi:hypothetical protein
VQRASDADGVRLLVELRLAIAEQEEDEPPHRIGRPPAIVEELVPGLVPRLGYVLPEG